MFLFLFLASLYPFLTGPRGSSGKTLLLKPKYRLKFSTCRLLNHHNSAFFQYPIYTPNCCWKIFLFLGKIPTLLGFRPKKHCRWQTAPAGWTFLAPRVPSDLAAAWPCGGFELNGKTMKNAEEPRRWCIFHFVSHILPSLWIAML